MIPLLQKGQVGRTILGGTVPSGDTFADLILENEAAGSVGDMTLSMVNPITGVYGQGYTGSFGLAVLLGGNGVSGYAGTPTAGVASLLGGAFATGKTDIEFPVLAGANIIYSNRKLVANAANKCVTLQRSSDGATSDIGFVNGIIDTAAITSFVGSSGAKATVAFNQADPSNNLTKPGPNSVDVVIAGAFQDGLKCDRSATSGLISTLNSSDLNQYTMFLRVKIVDVITGGAYTLYNHGGPDKGFVSYPNTWTTPNWWSNGNEDFTVQKDGSNSLGTRSALPSAGTWVVYAVKVDLTAPSLRVWKDNVETTTHFNTGSVGTTLTLGAKKWIWGVDYTSAQGSNSTFSDIILFESLLSDSDISTINASLVDQTIHSLKPSVASFPGSVSAAGSLGSFGLAKALTTVSGTGGVGTVVPTETFSLWRYQGMDWQPSGATSDYVYATASDALAAAQYNYETTWGEPHPGYSRGAYILNEPAYELSSQGAPLTYSFHVEVGGGNPGGQVHRYVL